MSPFSAVFLPLDELLDVLAANGFYLGVDTHLRLQHFLGRFAQKPAGPMETLRFQLAALLAHSAEQQDLFYKLFDEFYQLFLAQKTDSVEIAPPIVPPADLSDGAIPTTPPVLAPPVAAAPPAPVKPPPTVGRSGPIRVELNFPANPLRIWNTAELDQAARLLREKEWTLVQEWDVAASILRTIRAGGIPTFELRRRKKPPQYLLLIDQKSPRDHLAGFYAELAAELNRRDLTAEYFFYDSIPQRCWKDRRDPRTFTTVENLQGEYAGYKLLLVGEPQGLLDRPDLRPSNLAVDLRENWAQVALLCPKPTATWGNAELALCQLFPVVPANAAGLHSLLAQWGATEVFSPQYWQSANPESPVPDTRLERPQDADALVEEVQHYLGRNGFQWLCAAAVYPEIYWELTALLHDESIPPELARSEHDMNRVWWVALLRLSRLGWFRQGSIPVAVRTRLRQLFDARLPLQQRQAVRRQLGDILKENPLASTDSYAAANRAFTLAWLDYESTVVRPGLTENEQKTVEAEFREQAVATVALSDIEDAIGRKLFEELQAHPVWPGVPDAPGLHVLWVDDEPKNNERFQDELNELLHGIFTNATGTEEALAILAQRGFDLIISDVSRHRRDDAGAKMLTIFREKGIVTPVIFYTTPAMVEKKGGELRELGAAGVFSNHEEVRTFMGERVREKQQRSNSSADIPPEYVAQPQSQQQSSAAPPDTRIATAREAQKTGDKAMENKRYATAAVAYQQALNLFTELKDDTERAATHQALGKLYVATNDLQSALQHFKSASTLYLGLNLDPAYAYALMDIGSVQRKRGQLAEAQEAYEQAGATWQELGDNEELVQVLNALGTIAHDRKDYGQAIQSFENALQIVPNLKTNDLEAGIRNNLALAHQEAGNLDKALTEFQRALEIYTAVNNKDRVEQTEKSIVALRQRLASLESQTKQGTGIKEQIQTLIANGQTEDALALLSNSNNNALLLRGQYNSGKKNFDLGLIDFGEWQRIQARVNYGVLEMAKALEDHPGNTASGTDYPSEPQGLILYRIPSTMQVGEKVRCTVRIGATAEILQKDWQASSSDVQQPIQIAEVASVELKQAAENESDEWVFDIKRDPATEQIVTPLEYSEWRFEVEPERTGSYRLVLEIMLLDQDNRRSTQLLERQVVVTDGPTSRAKKSAPVRKRK